MPGFFRRMRKESFLFSGVRQRRPFFVLLSWGVKRGKTGVFVTRVRGKGGRRARGFVHGRIQRGTGGTTLFSMGGAPCVRREEGERGTAHRKRATQRKPRAPFPGAAHCRFFTGFPLSAPLFSVTFAWKSRAFARFFEVCAGVTAGFFFGVSGGRARPDPPRFRRG